MRHRIYLLAVLFVVQVFNSIDSMELGLALQEIKLDLSLTDTQLGVLTGIAFAFLSSVVGIPIARWADRGDRVAIIALTTIVWSVFVIACGFAANFAQLVLLRVAVGIAVAGSLPAAQSLIADYFSRAERPRANAVYMMAAGVSALFGFGLTGWLNELHGWRVTFTILGLSGIPVAVLVWFTLKEPRFEEIEDGHTPRRSVVFSRTPFKCTGSAAHAPGLVETIGLLWSNRTLRHLLLFWSVSSFFVTALWQWQPVFFERSHGMSTGKVGALFAIAYGVGATLGPFWGGAWASRYAANNESLQLRIAALVFNGLMVVSFLIYLVPASYVAFGLLGIYAVGVSVFTGPLWAMIQTLVPENMRAAVTAIFALLGSLLGNGVGSLVTGALSDALRPQLGVESLRYALVVLCPGFLWAAWHLSRASKSVKRDLEVAEKEHKAHWDHDARRACAVLPVSKTSRSGDTV